MTRIGWVPAVLRGAGLTVVEVPGCYGRGPDIKAVLGVVIHGTGTSPTAKVDNVVRILRDGRSDLAGPLAQGVDRDGVWHFVADGKCNHNGYGEWGNASIGVEMFGTDTFTAAQLASAQLGTAAILRHLDLPPSRCKGHKETDPGRKPDPIGVDMDAFRAAVELDMDHLDHGTHPDEEEILLWA